MRVNAVLPGLIVTPMIEKLHDGPGFKNHFGRALELLAYFLIIDQVSGPPRARQLCVT